MDSLSCSAILQPPTDTTNIALVAHEEAVAEVRRAIGSSNASVAASSLRELDSDDLARRLRTSARARGAVAHPDGALASDIKTAYDDARNAEQAPTAWSLDDLRDVRKFRRTRSQAVEPPAAAAPALPRRAGSVNPVDGCAAPAQSTAQQSWRPELFQDDRRPRPGRAAPPQARLPPQRAHDADAGAAPLPRTDPSDGRVDSLGHQLDILANLQLHSLQSIRREIDVLRNAALKGIYALEGEVRTLAVAECVEERDEELVREFNAEAMAGRAAISELHDRLFTVGSHIEGIWKEVKAIHGGMGSIDSRLDEIQRQLDEQQARESRCERAELGMMAFAKRIEARVDDVLLQFDGTLSC